MTKWSSSVATFSSSSMSIATDLGPNLVALVMLGGIVVAEVKEIKFSMKLLNYNVRRCRYIDRLYIYLLPVAIL